MALDHPASDSHHTRLYAFSWALILYTLVIIAWGAWVRISGSGDGCGDHWPLCHGSAVPVGAPTKTWIEVSHRYSTALFGILVVAQLLALRCYLPAKHSARRWVWATVVFTITEALIGRSLVKHGLVNESQSLSRMFVMPLHLVNTSLLLCSAVMTAESIRHGYSNRKKCDRATTSWVITIGIGLLILLTTGAIAALGSHLMPSESLVAGLQHDWQPDAHLAVRLRVLHPILGLLLPMGLWIAATYKTASSPPPPDFIATLRRHLYLAIAGAVLIGIATLGLLAPPWLKLVHLTMANVLVILTARLAYHSLRAH